jgi:hypothetical protein
VPEGTPVLSVTFTEGVFWLQVSRADGNPARELSDLHEQELGPRELRRRLDNFELLSWKPLRVPPGMPSACEGRVGDYMLTLLARKGADVGWETLVREFRRWLGRSRGGRRLPRS